MEGLTAVVGHAKIGMVYDIGCNSSIKSPSDSRLHGNAYHGNARPNKGMPRRQRGANVRPFVQIWDRISGSKSEDRGSRPRGPYQKI